MKYLKHPYTGEVFAFEADGTQDEFIPAGLVPMEPAEIEAHLNPLPSLEGLCIEIDAVADLARKSATSERDIEYQKAADEARDFRAAGYPSDAVPRSVAAWAISGRSAQQAADEIIAKALLSDNAIYALREIRLLAKEQVRTLMAQGAVLEAQGVARQAIDAINRQMVSQ